MAENSTPCHFKLVMGKNKLNDEGYTLYLIVRKFGIRRMISTGFFGYPHQWDEEEEEFITDNRTSDLHPFRKEINAWLVIKKKEVEDIQDDFKKKKINWTSDQFVSVFLNEMLTENVHDYMMSIVNTLLAGFHWGTANQYFWTCHNMHKFDPDFLKRVWSEMDYNYIKRFDFKLATEGNKGKGCVGNTRAYYLKGLRAAYNQAILSNCAMSSIYPFGKGGFSISKLEEDTPKRYIKSNDFQKVKNDVATNQYREKVRKIFLFCYYAYGMSIRDAALLKKKNILALEDGNYIVYKRIKTKNNRKVKPIFVKIGDSVQELLNWFKENTTLIGDYLIPVVSKDYEDESLLLYNHITYRNRRINTLLKEIAKDLLIDMNITTHVNRHTAANRLKDMNIPRDVISEMFGHADTKTTETYLDSFEHNVTAEAGAVL